MIPITIELTKDMLDLVVVEAGDAPPALRPCGRCQAVECCADCWWRWKRGGWQPAVWRCTGRCRVSAE